MWFAWPPSPSTHTHMPPSPSFTSRPILFQKQTENKEPDKTMTRPPGMSRRRPKRQRTPTTLYSDDNPSTFTVKKKKGEPAPEPVERPKPSCYYVEEEISLPPKRPYRRKKPYNKHELTSAASRVVSSERAASPTSTATPATVRTTPSTTTTTTTRTTTSSSVPAGSAPVKRKRGRPPKKKNIPPPTPPPRPATPPSVQEEHETVDSRPLPTRSQSLPSSSSPASVRTTSWTPPSGDATGSYLAHSVTVAPVLPPVRCDDQKTQQNQMNELYPNVFGKGLGTDKTVEQPKWSSLYTPDVYFEDDYSSDDNRHLDPSVLPVTRSITCVTTRKPDHQYMAVGDSAGFCIIYSMGSHIRPVARLETVACQQRARAEQEKIREIKLRKKGKLRSLVMDTSQTCIHALAMIGTRVVVATACELECMDVPSQTSLWVCPLSSERLVTSLDMHLSTYDVLVSCSLYQQPQQDQFRSNCSPLVAPTSPLMLLQHSRNNVEICDANSPLLVKSPCCTAIWDISKSVENRLLFVAVSDTDQELELVLVQGGSIDNWKVACKTRIPVKASNHQTKLSQSPEGIYTLVASSRGIRLYQTETLQLIHVYGDQLSLHGKSVVWQDCLLLGNTNRARNPSKIKGNNAHYDDWLSVGSNDGDEQDKEVRSGADLGHYVVGVPSFKGPKELCETLHVWKVEQASTVPALSIPLPPKSDGCLGLVKAPPMGGGDRIVAAGRNGEGYAMLAKMSSDFAGIMYAPGYHVLTDNIEFIEDEDALDHVDPPPPAAAAVEEEEHEDEEVIVLAEDLDDEMDEDLREAMRQSLLEQKRLKARMASRDEDVDVLTGAEVEAAYPLIPCRPEAYLRQNVNCPADDLEDGNAEEGTKSQTHQFGNATAVGLKKSDGIHDMSSVFISNILEAMPNTHKSRPLREEGFTVTAKIVVASTNPVPANRPGRGKRSRSANLEAMMKASIDPHLQRLMISRSNHWADGSGSSISSQRQTDTLDNLKSPLHVEVKTSIPVMEDPKQVTPPPDSPDRDGNLVSVGAEKYQTERDAKLVYRTVSEGSNGDAQPVLGVAASDLAPATTTSNQQAELMGPSNLKNAHFGQNNSNSVKTLQGHGTNGDNNNKNGNNIGGYVENMNDSNEICQDIKACTPKNVVNAKNGAAPSLVSKIGSDEAAVALGLLGLSPSHVQIATADQPEAPSSSTVVISKTPLPIQPKVGNVAGETSYLRASLARANLASPNLSESLCSEIQNVVDRACDPKSESLATSSDPDNSTCDVASDSVAISEQEEQRAESKNKQPTCRACCGRLVIHTCGKRALPIDYDLVAKAERERKQKEEEEKKKMRAEKRRQADARRREAKKQKQKQKELEERRRREEELRLEQEKQLRLAEQQQQQREEDMRQQQQQREEEMRQQQQRQKQLQHAQAHQAQAHQAQEQQQVQQEPPSNGYGTMDSERKRREMIVASYASYTSNGGATIDSSAYGGAKLSTTVYNGTVNRGYGTNPSTGHRGVQNSTISHYAPPPQPASNLPAQEPRPQAKMSTGQEAKRTESNAAAVSRKTSMGMLSSADALVALATLSSTRPQQQQPPQPSTSQVRTVSATTTPSPSYTYMASESSLSSSSSAHLAPTPTPTHGFSVDSTRGGGGGGGGGGPQTKRAIPSYASIYRSKMDGTASTIGRTAAAYVWPSSTDSTLAQTNGTDFYSERLYNPITGKEYTAEEKAQLQR